ncbi:unnamed protein product [Brassica oleracea]|uniref:(rape) hypothetical protein n=1 Tax=Brassica napus TaxID=3708 RepID=A0A816I1G5_BRANA|nr:unnamed protein product [Brassica napus]
MEIAMSGIFISRKINHPNIIRFIDMIEVLKRGRSGRLRAGAALGVGAPPRFSSVRPKTRPKKHTSYYAISKFENDNFFTNPL